MTIQTQIERSSNMNLFALKTSMIAAAISIAALLGLHVLSPEFQPSWRMVSEYANGRFEWVLFVFFVFWGLSSWCLAFVLWSYVSSRAAKVGVLFLFISGLGEILAAFFNVNHPLHGLSGTLGIPTFIIAALMISYHLKTRPEWKDKKRTLLMYAHATWISVALLVVTMIVMINGFKQAGIELGPGQQPPQSVPGGVIAIVGYVNRILIGVYIGWLLFVSSMLLKIARSKSLSGL